MKKLCFLVVWSFTFHSENPYAFQVKTIHGETIKLERFAGKKILIVNTASESKYSSQYDSLEVLANRFNEKLVVIAFPSNSFNHEPGDSLVVSEKLPANQRHFILSDKVQVIGSNQDPLFKWLSVKELNGMMDCNVLLDFQKYLIDEHGQFIGVFAPSVNPLSNEMINAINLQ